MVRILIPFLMLCLGAGAGVGVALILGIGAQSAHTNEDTPQSTQGSEAHSALPASLPGLSGQEYVKLNNQFVIPIVKNDRVKALVVLALSVEVSPGQKETIYAREPKLRDSFLQVLFDHANVGGFDGEFTDANNLDVLRKGLREVAQKALGDIVSDVLIIDIARQDV